MTTSTDDKENREDSVRGVLQILRNKPGATFKDVRVHCSMRGDDLSTWPAWIADAEGYVTEAAAARMIYEIMQNQFPLPPTAPHDELHRVLRLLDAGEVKMAIQALQAIVAAPSAREPKGGGWISTRQYDAPLPPNDEWVLIWYRGMDGWSANIGRFIHALKQWRPVGGNGDFAKDITHWMPLPSAPTERGPT